LLWTSLLGAAMIGGYFFFYPVTNADEINSTLLVSTPGEKSPASLSGNPAAVAPAEKGSDKHSEIEGTKHPAKNDFAAPNKANAGEGNSRLAEANKANAGEGNSLLAATNKANAGEGNSLLAATNK